MKSGEFGRNFTNLNVNFNSPDTKTIGLVLPNPYFRERINMVNKNACPNRLSLSRGSFGSGCGFGGKEEGRNS
jgi:hypothetical protein